MKSHIPHPPTAYRLPPAAATRRGVLILVVLSLLVMFALMAMTYVLLASKQLQSAKSFSRTQTNAGSPQGELETAFMQLARDTTNEHSVMRDHSFLIDMYGDPTQGWDAANNRNIYGPNSIRGAVGDTITPLVGNQLVDFNAVYPADILVSPIEGYYEGCVITMTSGAARGLSSRIVRYYNDSSGVLSGVLRFRVMTFKSRSGPVTPATGDTFLVNGRPFSGTGFGNDLVTRTPPYPPGETGALDAVDDLGREFALMPNAAYYQPTGQYDASVDYPQGVPFGGPGGANEGYDAPDYQNLHMSLVDQPAPNQIRVVLPSFHRPDLINFWKNRTGPPPIDWADPTDANTDGDPDARALLRKISLRPTPLDHPNFTGSNPFLDINNFNWQTNIMGLDSSATNFLTDGAGNPVNPWDVDNDGDGVADSVWLDLGFPVRTMLDGRKYKPLFAFHVVDLDSRVNVNAHGSSLHTDPTYGEAATAIQNGPIAGSPTVALARGQGFGPAEINLRMVFQPAEVDALLHGVTLGGPREHRAE